ncbi:hypothetical protein FSP39_002938 [Pinctada imbricata]|uniref:Ion transport domain-containing protein n=1 Tax=Pinctada imbricata TaxID=66713 RepID=A0AA89BSC2_PINIB|nr:hypothetical protein FSP39_002938 [Pinctada imbricata]
MQEIVIWKLNTRHKATVIKMSDVYFMVFQVAAKGDLQEFQKLYDEDNSRLELEDTKGFRPIHHATINGHLHIIEFILSNDGDINIKTRKGDTCLHIAVEKENLEILEFLIRFGAETSILNDERCAPVHKAVAEGRIKVLEKLLQLDSKSANLRAECGSTPLHICALKDQGEFESYGYSRQAIFSFSDKYNNSPLHSAVSGGNIDAVRVCLNAGAACDVQQEDKSTPLHFACAQGSLDMVKIMKEIQPEKFILAACTTDILRMTPLHRAAMFNHTEVIKFLLDEGADINTVDTQLRTPLLLAACKGCWTSVRLLLDRGADISLNDSKNRNFLHLAIKYGLRLNNFGVESIKYGRYNTCKRLLDSPLGSSIINEIDEDGLSALHLAALNGHIKIINLLMEKGASITRDYDDNSPLHMAVINCYTKSMKLLLGVHPNLLDAKNKNGDTALHIAGSLGQTAAVELLLTLGAKFEMNKEEKNFLDLAVENKHTEIAFAVVRHERWNEALHTCSPRFGCPMTRFIEHIPEACLAVLDRCQTSHGDPRKRDFYVEYNFAYLQCPVWFVKKKSDEGEEVLPMFALNMGYKLSVWVMMVLTIINVIKELVQMAQQRLKYFTSVDNLLEWVLYISTGMFVAPHLTHDPLHSYQWEAGAIAIFLAWFNCLLYFQRFDIFGIYVVMFLEILGTLLRVLCVFSILLVAFGLAFYILMKDEISKAYSTPPLSIARVAMMMLELDYMSSFNDPFTDDDPNTLRYGTLTFIFLIVFVLLMPILLINLLIGLAVGDIESVQKGATLKRLAMQVELHTDLERRLPHKLLEMVDKMKIRVYPNKSIQKMKQMWSEMMYVDDGSGCGHESKREYLSLEQELFKQKTRLKEISSNMEKQYELLRLIVQKMEIHTEADNRDEGLRQTHSLDQIAPLDGASWKSPLIHKNIMTTTSVISKWKKVKDDQNC